MLTDKTIKYQSPTKFELETLHLQTAQPLFTGSASQLLDGAH
jgi:hypothetical protein